MAKVGVREIRQHLSRYLRRVAEKHEEIVITDRRQAVAKLVPIAGESGRLASRQALRERISARGEPLSELLLQVRDEERA